MAKSLSANAFSAETTAVKSAPSWLPTRLRSLTDPYTTFNGCGTEPTGSCADPSQAMSATTTHSTCATSTQRGDHTPRGVRHDHGEAFNTFTVGGCAC
jgi:hypothetical protein